MKYVAVIAALFAIAVGRPALADWVKHPNAAQTIYQNGTPHTDRGGRPLTKYDPEKSFLPLGLYHALHGEFHGRHYKFAEYAAAGFNTCHLWEAQDPQKLADDAAAAGIQLIVHFPSLDQVKALRANPAILGWYLDEEPIGQYWDKDMEGHFKAFVERRNSIRSIDPQHPVFVLDATSIRPPARDWWMKWNSAGDVSSHDTYPINQHYHSLSYPDGLPEGVSLAVTAVDQKKPVWFCAQAFESCDQRWPFLMPSVRQFRCMTYAAFVHGATGVIQFAFDSWVTRNGNCVGIAADPQASYGNGLVATKDQLRMSRDLWPAAMELNKELAELRPALLSPTAKDSYVVSIDSAWAPVTSEPVRTLLKQHPDGGMVLLIVNVDGAPQRVRIELPRSAQYAQPMFDAANVAGFAQPTGALEMSLTPYDVRVVRLQAKDGKPGK